MLQASPIAHIECELWHIDMTKHLRGYLLVTLLACFSVGYASAEQDKPLQGPATVRIVRKDAGFQLLVNGKSFYVKGAGLEYGSQETLARYGGNSFRTWQTDNGQESGQAVLDRAYVNGLMVTMGLQVAAERGGFDYNDPMAVAQQLDRIKREVLLYKNHPALLMWSIGNELNLGSRNPKVWDAVNQISEMIHNLDPNHPTMTPLAGLNPELAELLKSRAGSLDLIGIQLYGDIANLSTILRQSAWNGPYIVTEWGPTGHWEVTATEWGAPIEADSSQKADLLYTRYRKYILNDQSHCLGSYVFLWGQKQERTPTWYGMFLESGESTEAVDIMSTLWSGAWPSNRSPIISSFQINSRHAIDNIKLEANQIYSAQIQATDIDQDSLSFRWIVMRESSAKSVGGDYEDAPAIIIAEIKNLGHGRIQFKAPTMTGNFRLFAYVYDGKGHAAHANLPFQVSAIMQ
jgi:Glycosyl hydrolases family 2, TIM barrel domain